MVSQRNNRRDHREKQEILCVLREAYLKGTPPHRYALGAVCGKKVLGLTQV